MSALFSHIYKLKFSLTVMRILILWCLLITGLADTYRGALSYDMSVYPIDKIYVNLIFYMGVLWLSLALIESIILTLDISNKFFKYIVIYRCTITFLIPSYIICKLFLFHIPFYFSDLLIVGGIIILQFGTLKLEYWKSQETSTI